MYLTTQKIYHWVSFDILKFFVIIFPSYMLHNSSFTGWDGKPIPYWLYKLHGLNISYNCEICGNFTYKGPKAFQRHFAEWRHAHGMRCLGIPNTAHFANVTQIEDALACKCLILAIE